MQITIPSQAEVAPDLYRAPHFNDHFRFGTWRDFTAARAKLYKPGDVVWIVRDGDCVKALIDRVTYWEHNGAYRWLEVYQAHIAVRFEDRWSVTHRYVIPANIRDGYELHTARAAGVIAIGKSDYSPKDLKRLMRAETRRQDREPVAYMRDLDGSGSYHVCSKGDPGAFPVYR